MPKRKQQPITAEEVAAAEAALDAAKDSGADTTAQQHELVELRSAFRRQEEEAGRRGSLVNVEES